VLSIRFRPQKGFISVNAGLPPEANSILAPKKDSDPHSILQSVLAAAPVSRQCKNASAMLFVSAKISQFRFSPQGKIEAKERVRR